MTAADATTTFSQRFLAESQEVISMLDGDVIEQLARELADVRARGGRLFCVGSGGGAAHASHAVCDFRKLAGIEAYCPTDNAAELTARVNDDGWESSYAAWLRGSRIGPDDLLLVFSVGGGDVELGISPNLVHAIDTARTVGARVIGIVGRDGGYTARVADACLVVPTLDQARVTPHVEALQSLVAHLLVSHPAVAIETAKWESVQP
jgi:D-sedoheptulose 7-phosphate isomerase